MKHSKVNGNSHFENWICSYFNIVRYANLVFHFNADIIITTIIVVILNPSL
jgi:5'(3')-deoxyribonucleotidase